MKLFKSPREAYCAMTTVNEYGPPDLENSDSSISVQHVTPSLPSSGIITREDPEDAKTFVGEALSLVASQQFGVDIPKQFCRICTERYAETSDC